MIGTSAVFFDVDFTLIHPGPRFQGSGYQASCRKYDVHVDPGRFEAAVRGAALVLEGADDRYDADLYVRYTARIIELMGGSGAVVEAIAREMYEEWAENHHFVLYDDVRTTLRELTEQGYRVGLISNSHRCLVSFQAHFELTGLIDVTVSSADLGVMKPHPSIFQAALLRMGVMAEAAVMVGDSLVHDVNGAMRVGMHGVWLVRGDRAPDPTPAVTTIGSLRELPALLSPAAR